ncbi:VCBS repeat-containing protein [Moritella sp. 36]|uniref:polymorphic toxin-type HINT domain-containing protein n=1 Tax=Moritella sp. 36 TaxID=2746233 RepID=UPI001BA7AC4B|nr:polymorphic toxin-type HINT domain-containing protein [Moritella sp. 36]QUM89654.1 VCBS repeat-containing protein [Moritella sp. 36]
MNHKLPLLAPHLRFSTICCALVFLVLFSSCFSANAFTEQGNGGAMLSGDFDVSGGQATYSLPISVPVGRAGLQPSLSFKYQSDSPNGTMGMGWNVAGLSSVYRCGKNLAIDGVWGGVSFNSDDRFCLDGERLITVSGNPGGNGTEYRLEKNGYSKIISYGSQGSGPSYFKVWQKDGSVYEYGNTGNAKVELPGQSHVYKWTINKMTDITKRNHIVFNYVENTDGHYIKRISYVGGEVEFNYQGRDDKTSRYLGGSLLKRSLRLSEVRIKDSTAAEVGKYALNYGKSTGTQRSILNQIQYCSAGKCSSPIRFNWQSRSKVILNSPKSNAFAASQFFDANRDGQSSPYLMSYKGRSLALQGSINQPSLYSCYSDQGQANSYMPNADGILKAYCSKTDYGQHDYAADYIGNSKPLLQRDELFAADINGDGKDDKYRIEFGELHYLISGNGNTFDKFSGEKFGGFQSHRSRSSQFNRFVDINNDGYLDAVFDVIHKKCRGFGGDKQVYCDSEYQFEISLFNGISFTPAYPFLNLIDESYPINFADINNDGYPEAIRGTAVYKNQFGKLEPIQVMSIIEYASLLFQDVNGDGWSDILTTDYIQTSQAFAQDKIYKIEEYGVVYDVDYKPAVDTSVHKQVPYYKYPIVNSTPRKYLVANVHKSPRGYKRTRYNYKYEGARSHLRGYGFLGFSRITETESADVVTVTTTNFYSVDYPFSPTADQLTKDLDPRFSKTGIWDHRKVGKPVLKTVFRNDKKISETKFTYATNEWQGVQAKYHQVYANKIENTLYSLSPNPKVEKQDATSITQDRFGNITNEVKILSVGGGKDTVKQFKLENKTQYLSTDFNSGYTQHNYNVGIQKQQPDLNKLLSKYTAGMKRYCSTSGGIYFKPNDGIVLIHGDIITPIVLRHDDYYRYDVANVGTGTLAHQRHYSGKLVAVSGAEFKQQALSLCGNYQVSAGGGSSSNIIQTDASTQSNRAATAKRNDEFWRLSAPIKVVQRTTDLQHSNLTREVTDSFGYFSNGLLAQNITTGNGYGKIWSNKHLKYAYRYDDYGNITHETVSGSDLYERQNITKYDGQGLFPAKLQNHYSSHTTGVSYDTKSGLLSKSVSPNKGRTTRWTYDNFQRIKSEIRPGTNNVTTYAYQLNNCKSPHPQLSRCSITNATEGGSVITQYDYAGREVRELHQDFNGKWVFRDTRWDRNGRKLSITRPAYISQIGKRVATVYFVYDERDREIEKREPAANGGTAVFSTGYDGLVTTITDARGFKDTTLQNVLGHILVKTEALGASQTASQTYTYYPDGKLKTTTDAKGNTTVIDYDNLGYRSHLDDPDMGKWRYNYNALGELIFKEDANKVQTSIKYDRLGRKIAQNDGGSLSEWKYDAGAVGTLSSHQTKDNKTSYYYNAAGLVENITMNVAGENFTTRYYYDQFERVTRELRPNGKTAANKAEFFSLEYVYNEFGYQSAVRSPKSFADDAFKSAEFRSKISGLIDQALAQAEKYLEKATYYKNQKEKILADYKSEARNVHYFDAAAQALLAEGNIYQQWCADNSVCYLRPAVWVLIHGDVTIPLLVGSTDSELIYRINSTLDNKLPGIRAYRSKIYKVSESEFNAQPLKKKLDLYLTDTLSGDKTLVSATYYGANPKLDTSPFNISRFPRYVRSVLGYEYYAKLAAELLTLVEQVVALSDLNCDSANQLAGNNLDVSKRNECINHNQTSQVDHLNTLLKGSEAANSLKDEDYIYYWQRRDTDAFGHTLSETLGNGLANTYVHNVNTGRLDTIATHVAGDIFNARHKGQSEVGRNLRLLHYTYDNHNNVIMREDQELGITDIFRYDALDRLDDNRVILDSPNRHGKNNADFNTVFDFNYDKLGNIVYKTGIGAYKYEQVRNAGPHAVTQANGLYYSYDKVGNLLQAQAAGAPVERELEWTAFNKPSKITRRGKSVEFFYDANHQRYKKISSDGSETIYFGKQYERVTDSETGDVQHKQFIYAGGKLIALNTQAKDSAHKLANKQVRYLHYDALDSVDMITDGYGNVVEHRSFDPWGKMRSVIWEDDSVTNIAQQLITNRGFTGHEHIEEVGLIHMNGRVYDQELGRFLSADPVIQAPFVTNSFNRYSYVMNNPLKYTDPTGFSGYEGGACTADNSGSSSNQSSNSGSNGCGPGRPGGHSGKGDGSKTTSSANGDEADSENKDISVDKNMGTTIVHGNNVDYSNDPDNPYHHYSDSSIDNTQAVLDVAGQIPGLGIFADLVNAALYAYQGDMVNASISLFSMIPIVGNAASAGRIGRRTYHKLKKAGVICSFVAGTIVATSAGAISINELKVGDTVLASNDSQLGAIASRAVKGVFVENHDFVVNLDIKGVNGSETIVSTSEHPFWVKGKGWVPVESLSTDDVLSDLDGNDVVLNNITIVPGPQTAYNLEVDIAHTYAVGQNQVWVHNTCKLRNSPEKEALVKMAKEDARKGITKEDLKAYKELNSELPDPFSKNEVRGPERHLDRPNKEWHAHVGPVNHIPIK